MGVLFEILRFKKKLGAIKGVTPRNLFLLPQMLHLYVILNVKNLERLERLEGLERLDRPERLERLKRLKIRLQENHLCHHLVTFFIGIKCTLVTCVHAQRELACTANIFIALEQILLKF